MMPNRDQLRRAGRPSVVLLLEDSQGATLAVRFPTAEAARTWEDRHPEVVAIGTARYVSDSEALKLSRAGETTP